MDLDASDNFYDEISSFMSQTGDYTFDDLDEILRATDSQLDSSIDLNTFVPHNVADFDMPMFHDETSSSTMATATTLSSQQLQSNKTALSANEFNFGFPTFPSPGNASVTSSAFSPPYDSQRDSGLSSSSASSMHDVDETPHFNPDEFINFLNDDGIKIDDFSSSTLLEMRPPRNTPSPTGSCSSSSGSSTSGVQSDASQHDVEMGDALLEVVHSLPSATAVAEAAARTKPEFVKPTTIPSVHNATAAAASNMLSTNLLPGTLIPVKTVPCLKTPNIIKVEAKAQSQIKVVNAATTAAHIPLTSTAAASVSGKVTPPSNSKPKTIFLSSNDFKTLMQKMNPASKSVASTGSKPIGGGITAAQMPKIIVKTANGKVITANKISSASPVVIGKSGAAALSNANGSSTTNLAVPKVVKTPNGSMIIKQHHASATPTKFSTSNVAAAAARRASLSGSSSAPDHNIYKGHMDDKMYKKQQRMIKNRESASLSRKKKKEYVVSLETRINNLEKENYSLKGENTSLRSQLLAYAQTCQCKHGNIGEFILNSLNAKSGNEPVKIAPKPANKSFKQRMSATTMKKNVAVLFAMAFMVTLNVGNFHNYFDKNSLENGEQIAAEEGAQSGAATSGSANAHRLLWVDTESEYKEKVHHRVQRDVKMEVPPLHFLRPVANRNGSSAAGETPPSPRSTSTTTTYANQTEYLRLDRNLRKWIDGNDYLNLSMYERQLNYGNDLANPSAMRFKLAPDYFELKDMELPLQGPLPNGKPQKRKFLFSNNERQNELDGDDDKLAMKHPKLSNTNTVENAANSLGLYKPKISEEYLRLFNGIKRQEDTFYVLSFNMDHILLPASAYNKSSRPKMSLMLPAGDPSMNGDIVLMQIDCEVVNTTELELKSHMIPEKMRPIKQFKTPQSQAQPNDVAQNETGARQPAGNMPRSALKAEDIKLKHTPPKTYVVMGPKTQAQAEAIASFNRKTAAPLKIVKLSNNEMNLLRNSTLFAKMKETVEQETGGNLRKIKEDED